MTVAYDEIVDFIASGTTPESVIAFNPSSAVKAQVADLIRREKTGGLTPTETAELKNFLHIEHVMRLAKARARLRLGQGPA